MKDESKIRLDTDQVTKGRAVDGNGRNAQAAHVDYLGDLLVNHSRSLHIRFSRERLTDAVTYRMLAAVLGRLIEPDDDAPNIQSVLQSQKVMPAADARFTVTEFGEKLLYERNSSVRADVPLEKVFLRRGIEVARQALGKAAMQLLSDENLTRKAQEIGEGILDALNEVNSFHTHLECLRSIVEELSGLNTAISARVSNCSRRTAMVQSRLSAGTPAGEQANKPTKLGRWERLREQFEEVKERLNPRSEPDRDEPAIRPARAAEKELLGLELEMRALRAESTVLGQIVVYLNREIAVDENSLRVMDDERQKLLIAASGTEITREYGIAGGEMLLNSSSLSEAVMNHIFVGSSEACANQVVRLRGQVKPVLDDAQGDVTSGVVAEMQQIVREEVYDRLKNLTVTDAIAALHLHDRNFHGKVREAFRMTASLDFLAAGYENYLDLQKFVSVSYPNSNKVACDLFNELFRTLQLEAETRHDPADAECLRLHIEYFAVPLRSFRFYDESHTLFESEQNNPSFRIHPELH